jgi:uncharacterized protein (DUF427 family)
MVVESHAQGRVKVEQGHKRVRAYLDGQLVADTIRPLLVWEVPYYPTYYVPGEDIRAKLVPTGASEHSPGRGDAEVLDVVTGDRTAAGAARRYPDSPIPQLRDAVRLEWNAMDEWLEEDEPVYIHPRDPYVRVDILSSSRHVRMELDGVLLAESNHPTVLFETGLPPRYYLPLSDLRRDLLRPSQSETYCPYKGTAGYWSVLANEKLYEDLVWIYRMPVPESQKIAGLACFENERVDLDIDGVRQPRPA